MHLDPDRLALLALGEEPVTKEVADHLASCRPCQAELESLRDLVDLDADTDKLRDVPAPPPRVWDSIMRQILAESQLLSESQAAELTGPIHGSLGHRRIDGSLGADATHRLVGRPSGHEVAPSARAATDDVVARPSGANRPNGPRPKRSTTGRRISDPPPRGPYTPAPASGPGRNHRRALQATAIAIAAAVIGVAGTLGVVALRDSDGTKLVSRAQLAPQPTAPAGARGSVEVVRVGSATELRLALAGMPAPPGYYEAWLFDPVSGAMYPMGPITASGGTVTVTGVDLDRYRGVDISAQSVDGTGDHGQSMLRGALR